MPCYKPLHAWRSKSGIYFGTGLTNLKLPCGRCRGCRLEHSRQWAVRCMHEASMHKHNAYITLTYNAEHVPEDGNLRHRDVQLFLKRLRKAAIKGENMLIDSASATPTRSSNGQRNGPPDENQNRLRPFMGLRPIPRRNLAYYMAGEYGELHRRPHYHLCIFGLDFADKRYLRKSPSGERLYRSPTLEKLWPLGFSSIGTVTFQSAAYVARYCMKKVTGPQKERHYEKIDQQTGEITKIIPEYNQMSRRPGIGAVWLDKYTADVYTSDQVIVKGRKTKPPRYYDKRYELTNKEAYDIIKEQRLKEAYHHRHDNTRKRLAVKEQVAAAQTKRLKRTL